MLRTVIALFIIGGAVHASSKRDDYLISCQGNYLLGLSRTKTVSIKERQEAKEFINNICGEISKKKNFASLKDPMFQGCFDSMFFVPDINMQDNERKRLVTKLRVDNCGDLEGR